MLALKSAATARFWFGYLGHVLSEIAKWWPYMSTNWSSRCPIDWRQRLAVATVFGLTLQMACVVGIGLAIRHGDVVQPALDVSLGGLHIITYIAISTECQLYLPCQNS